MQKMLLLTVLLMHVLSQEITQCTCLQLSTSFDCNTMRSGKCSWNSELNICEENTKGTISPFCQGIPLVDCNTYYPCALIDDKCTFFTGCSAYQKNTNSECIAISQRCSTNGRHCVNNVNDSCDEIAKTITTDKDCRSVLSHCTTAGAGCRESGLSCSDQKSIHQCAWNQNMTIQCYWNGGCMDRTCENAPRSLTSDILCQGFIDTCRAQIGGGCYTLLACASYVNQFLCIINQDEKPCFWLNQQCLDKTCSNAPFNIATNEECNQFLEKCITNGQGCVENGACVDIVTQLGCVISAQGTPCIWENGTCSEKICENAPRYYVSFSDCSDYLSTCTVNETQSGCTQRTCLNAPQSHISNSQCESYLPNNHCITKMNGGCKTNTTCSQIDIKEACVADVNGIICFWNSDNQTCVEKTCANAPLSYNDDDVCTTYMKKCTVNLNKAGCTDRTCANLLTPVICTTDLNKNLCTYTSQCYKKYCNLAPSSYNTHELCQSYLDSCTVNSTYDGCFQIPLMCSVNKTKESCKLKTIVDQETGSITYGLCGWTEANCTDINCTNLSATNTQDCIKAGIALGLFNCIVNNSYNGCMLASNNCTVRQNQENCLYISSLQCVWNSSSNQCFEKTCETASLPDTTESLTIFSASNCEGYLSMCTVNSLGDGCIMAKNCEFYQNINQCSFDQNNRRCVWRSKCLTATCALAPSTNQTDDDCQKFSFHNDTCTVVYKVGKAGCVTKEDCEDYLEESQCVTSFNGEACFWHNFKCWTKSQFSCFYIITDVYSTANCEAVIYYCKGSDDGYRCQSKVCSDYVQIDGLSSGGIPISSNNQCRSLDYHCYFKSPNTCQDTAPSPCSSFTDNLGTLTLAICQGKNPSCVNNKTNTACIIGSYFCEDYQQENCTYDNYGKKCFWNSGSCVTISFLTCSLIQKGSGLRRTDCQAYSQDCTATRDGTTCINIERSCTSYQTLNNCVESAVGRCIQSNQEDSLATCAEVTLTTPCASLYLEQGTIYTQQICTELQSKCTYVSGPTCEEKTCANAVNQTSFINCYKWLNTCTFNEVNSCVSISNFCATQSPQQCYQAIEGPCVVQRNTCVKRISCDQADISMNNDTACFQFLSTCTVARLGGCQPRVFKCSSYLSQIQCNRNSNSQKCYWNTNSCVDLTCDNLLITNYTTHAQCYQADPELKCTIRASNGAVAKGCQSLSACDHYTISDQCVFDVTGALCYWNLSFGTCQDMTCSTADASFTTHTKCQDYLSNCTVAITNKIAAGCQVLAACSTYLSQDQCQIDDQGNACGWNGQKCEIKSCQTAPDDYDSYSKCSAFMQGCTVSSSGLGCNLLLECEQYTNVNQCVVNHKGQKCNWDSITNACQTRACGNAPTTANSDEECSAYLSECSYSLSKCRNANCEDFPFSTFSTDAFCSQFLPGCTSNGVNCVSRGTCEQAMTKIGCVTQSDGKQCQWVEVLHEAYCVIKSCDTAPISINTEADCAQYYPGCTTKSGGGCIIKTTCWVANIAGACTTDSLKNPCYWENNSCRDKMCSDYVAVTYKQCQKIKSNCILGSYNRCATRSTCQAIKNKQSCHFGTDGPCLWIDGVLNSEGTFGACFFYTDCTSIQWSTKEQCNLISGQCTTNGTNCVSITTCQETNTTGGCIDGTDGHCIQLKNNYHDAYYCQQFSCWDANYQTHEHCQQISEKCTSDGRKCMNLQSSCYLYKNTESCHFNDQGEVIKNGVVLLTGQCIWDNKNHQCRDQECGDLIGTKHDICNTQWTSCTTYGDNCGKMYTCQIYNQYGICPTFGSDGKCIMVGQCRLRECSDINNTDSCAIELSSCISDGQKCIKKSNCSSYLTKVSCDSGGTAGPCFYNSSNGQCRDMQSCFDAQDEITCAAIKNKCVYIEKLCQPNSCNFQYEILKICTYYSNWNNQIFFCSMINNVCTERKPQNMNQKDCLINSLYSYSWDVNTNSCQSCSSQPLNFDISESTNCSSSRSCMIPSVTVTRNSFAIHISLVIFSSFLIY